MSDKIPKIPTLSDYAPTEVFLLQERIDELERLLAKEKELSEAISRDCNATALERNELQSQLAEAYNDIAGLRCKLSVSNNVSNKLEAEIARMKPVVEAWNNIRKDYLKRLIAGVREEIKKAPENIEACEITEEEGSLSSKWIDAAILCDVVEHEILKEYEKSAPKP